MKIMPNDVMFIKVHSAKLDKLECVLDIPQSIENAFRDGEYVMEHGEYIYCDTANPMTAEGWIKDYMDSNKQLALPFDDKD